jgi:hypothetical protein
MLATLSTKNAAVCPPCNTLQHLIAATAACRLEAEKRRGRVSRTRTGDGEADRPFNHGKPSAMAEQLRVSHPGVDNTIEAILMGAVAGVQVLLFALGAAGVTPLAIFNNTEFLMLTLISMTQAVVAILINARTLRRSIGVGDSG